MDKSSDERGGSGEASVGDNFSRLNPQKMSRGLDEALVGVVLRSRLEAWVDFGILNFGWICKI
jgi:hypothetical protein